MTIRHISMIIIVAFFLSSCVLIAKSKAAIKEDSFTDNALSFFISKASAGQSIAFLTGKETMKPQCGKFTLPERKPLPVIPTLTEEQLKDNQVVQDVMLRIIKEHRDYILSTQRDEDEAYKNYVLSCG